MKNEKTTLKKKNETQDINPGGDVDILDTRAGGSKEALDTIVEEEVENMNKKNDNKAQNGLGRKKKKDMYNKPRRNPTEIEERKLVGKALEVLVVTALKNHVYQYDNKMRIQNKGGPIGLKLTGEVADCIMMEWDKKLMMELEKVNIETYVFTRFKDDIELVAESVERGTKLIDGKLVVDEEKKLEDASKSDAKITMEIISQIANSIDPMIQLTTETPCNFKNKMMPILDVQVRINKEEDNRIDFQFFEKETKNSKVILFDSAIDSKSKRTILTQECLRRLRNTKIELGEDIQRKHLNEFMVKVKIPDIIENTE